MPKFTWIFIVVKIFAKMFRKSHRIFSVFAKSFANIFYIFAKPAIFFILLAASLVPVLHIFSRKPSGKQKITRKQIVPQKPAKISCLKYCYKSGLIVSHVAANFAFLLWAEGKFVNVVYFPNFRENFHEHAKMKIIVTALIDSHGVQRHPPALPPPPPSPRRLHSDCTSSYLLLQCTDSYGLKETSDWSECHRKIG